MQPKKHLKLFIVDPNTGQTICSCGCGTVTEEKMADDSHFNLEKETHDLKQSHNLNKITTHDHGLTTVIQNTDHDYAGGKLTAEAKSTFYRLRQWQTRARSLTPEERRKAHLLHEIGFVANKMNTPDGVKQDACLIAIKYVEKTSHTALSRIIACGCLFLAYKRSPFPKTISDFDPYYTEARVNNLVRYSGKIKEATGLDFEEKDQTILLIYKSCNNLNLNQKVRDIAVKFHEVMKQESVYNGKAYSSRAGISIHYALIVYHQKRFYSYKNSGVNPEQIAADLGITIPVIRTGLNSMADVLYQRKDEIGFDPRIFSTKTEWSMKHWP